MMIANQQQTAQIMQALAVGRIIEVETALAQAQQQNAALTARVGELEAALAEAEAAEEQALAADPNLDGVGADGPEAITAA